jgi:hypothetical protein
MYFPFSDPNKIEVYSDALGFSRPAAKAPSISSEPSGDRQVASVAVRGQHLLATENNARIVDIG